MGNCNNAVSRTDCALTLESNAAMTCEADGRDKSEPGSWVQGHEGRPQDLLWLAVERLSGR